MVFFTAGASHSQQDSSIRKILINRDTVEIGNYYSFYLANKEAFLGKVINLNKNLLLVYYDDEIKTINIMDIVMIENPRKILFDLSVTRKKISEERAYWIFSTGLIRVRPYSMSNGSYGTYKNGFNIGAHSFVTFNNYFGLRADLDYIHIPKEDYQISYNSYSNNYSYFYTGGTVNGILTKFNIALGYFNPESLINVYCVPGIGIGGFFKTKQTTTSYSTNYSTGYYSNTTNGSTLYFTIGLSAGFGLSIKVNKHIRAFSEYQYNTWTSDISNFNCLKAGIIIRGK